MRRKLFGEERGQMILWIALAVPLLILFAAMALDMGLIYWTKAKLANATDAAVLTGVKTVAYWTGKDGSVAAGQADAQNYASKMFVGNFGSNAPTQTYTWCPGDAACPPNTTSLTLRATTTVNTTFMSYLPRWAQWTVGATSQATRGNLIMSLVLDRSGSMLTNGGAAALRSAVPTFIQSFSDGTDHVAMLSFASEATIDVPMAQNFINPVKDAVNAMPFGGGTFGTGAGTYGANFDATHGPPLSMADTQNNSVVFPQGSSVVKVVVYFTDGLMNTVQETFAGCNFLPNRGFYNFGGLDSTGVTPHFFDPTNKNANTNDYSILYSGNPTGGGCNNSGQNNTCNGNPPYSNTARCTGVTGFTSQIPSRGFQTFSGNQAAVTREAKFRATYTANQMRAESPIPTYIYVIGLGSEMTHPCTEAFLATLANDPSGSHYNCPAEPAVYNAALPPGLFLPVVNCPSPQCTQSLSQAFQTLAARILLRLSQ